MKKLNSPAPPRKKIPTSFRMTYAFSLPVELVELLKALSSEHNINVSRGAEIPIRKWAAKVAREINKKYE